MSSEVRDVRPDVVVVGSGPVGSAYVRLLTRARPDLDVLVVEAGPVLGEPAGQNLRNVADPVEAERARQRAQGPAAPGADVLPVTVPGTVTARQGTYLVDAGPDMPAAALASAVGGQGTLWTCAVPVPHDSERSTVIADEDWDAALDTAADLLARNTSAFSGSTIGKSVADSLSELFDPLLPAGRGVGILPVAGVTQDDGTLRWTGADTVLGDAPHRLLAGTVARRLVVGAGRVEAVELLDLGSGRTRVVRPKVVVVAADAFHTPQLLWASGIRPPALGRYLTEHPLTLAVVALRDDFLPAGEELPRSTGDPVASVINVPFAEGTHPFHAQVMHLPTCPPHLIGGRAAVENRAGFLSMGWGCRKQPRRGDGLVFSEDRVDAWGMPAFTVEYSLTHDEEREVDQALAHLTRAAEALGTFVPGGEPRTMPVGSSLHYQGTFRIGADGGAESVCDEHSRVWGVQNLFLGGNGTIPTATACNPTLTSVAIAAHAVPTVLSTLEDQDR